MIFILANVQVAPNRMQEALALSKQHVARSRTEPGCISHSVYEDKDKENHLVFVEEWESEEALQRHFAVPESGQFANALGAMAAVRPKIRLYKATELPFPGKSAAKLVVQPDRQRQTTKPGLAVRGTFSPARAWCPAVVGRLTLR